MGCKGPGDTSLLEKLQAFIWIEETIVGASDCILIVPLLAFLAS